MKFIGNAHAAIYYDEDLQQYIWLDLDSKNGTILILPGKRLAQQVGGPGNDIKSYPLDDGTIALITNTALLLRLPQMKDKET